MTDHTHVTACRHLTFDIDLGDRVAHTHTEALHLANGRASYRGRQTVRRHRGWWLTGVWYIQDVRSAQS